MITPAMPNSSGKTSGKKRTPRISTPPTPISPSSASIGRTLRATDEGLARRNQKMPNPRAASSASARSTGSMSGLGLRGWRCRWRLRRRRRLLLLLSLDLLPARDVAIVLVDVRREDVPTLPVGDEIQRAVTRRRRHRGEDRGAPGIADRSRRQAGDDVGVVGRIRLQVGARELATLHALAAGHAVDRRRIALQLHLEPQAIDID